jgi:circadian clock protein KaiC
MTFVAGSAGIGKSTLGLQFLVEGASEGEPGIFVSLEENEEQLRAMAESLDLKLESALDEDLVEIVYLARERVRPNQVLSMLTDKIRASKTRRLVLDGASHFLTEHSGAAEHRRLIDGLVGRFKELGVTALLTFETSTLHASGKVTDRGVSPIADNLVMLRYREADSGLCPTMTVIKTRGSAHDFKTHDVRIGTGGLRVGAAKASVPHRANPRKRRGRP